MKFELYMNKDAMLFFEQSVEEIHGVYNELQEGIKCNKLPNLFVTELTQKDVDKAFLSGELSGFRMALNLLKSCGRKMIYSMEE